ncbi:DUF1501 domain-containing protein [Polyangium mundeleinium]|uniref:DUF1501 domain-containing protein n=1 Tax=Polyangium mundeleinium TaxID=2995306 RepID=A0ABT5F6J0_9BACT|nr:DUF1501 domain-containing protein [Polyangium mundeleinium]MDC0749719.1 DUF1501 domain-containing protein [Polyangium mundeleinium]
MKRRNFLKSAAAMAAAASGVGVSLWGMRQARAFGEVPKDAQSIMLPPELRAQNILEIFLYGGISQYESFYCVPEYGQADSTGWYAFLNSGEVLSAVNQCGFSGDLTEPFAGDANGKSVHFGPFVMPLRERPDVMQRVRVSITAHDLEPHEGAIPMALAGRGLGHPALSGLGAHIQRYFLEREPSPGRAPFSYVLMSNEATGLPTDNIRTSVAIGMHPGAARPLGIKVDAAGDLASLLARGSVGPNRAQYDALMNGHIERYQARLRWRGQGDPLRSPRLGELVAASSSIANASAIMNVLEPQYFQKFGASNCGDSVEVDPMTMNLKLATHLLTHPISPARYVCVIDTGLISADGGGGYDTHVENSHTQSRNLSHTLRALLSVVNKPGENDPNKLDLDKTMIVLTTEFGRTPFKQAEGGRNHWPYGFPIVFIGGPVRGTGKGVFGACGPDARATQASTAQENRMAALLALGIWPFAQESYNVSDVPGAATELQGAQLVQQRQLGVQS